MKPFIYTEECSQKKVYIGQTKHFLTRNKEHFSGNEKKFNKANFNKVIVLFSAYFNGSALDDVENQLITFFTADNPGTQKQSVQFNSDDVINLTNGNSITEYRGRERISTEVVLPFWENELFPNGWVNTPTIEKLRTQELVKYSPIKSLTKQQNDLIDEVIDNQNQNLRA